MKMPRRLNKKQLAEFFSVYRDAFPTWKRDDPCSFIRTSGPVQQLIFIESLSTGEYRLVNCVDLLFPIPDGCGLLAEHLSPRYNHISPRRHPSMWPKVLAQIDIDFQPSVRETLSIERVLKLVEDDRRLHDSLKHCAGLASMHAFLGNRKKAQGWCQQSLALSNRRDGGPADWETRKLNFVVKLQEALASGRELELLDPTGLWR